MALTHVVDTSVLTRLRTPAVRDAVGAAGRTLAVTTITGLELGHSARTGDEWDDIQSAVAALETLTIEPHHFRRALQAQRMLAVAGLRGRKIPDLLIAACAEDHGLAVLHYDRDFDHIASATGQRCDWVTPAGSID